MLEVLNVTKTYGKAEVLRGVSFTLSPGECLGVAGHNGSGKSTLLSVVAQVVPPSTGQLLWNGRDVLGDKAFLRANMGYVPQKNSLLEDLTVLETLQFWQRAYPLSPQDLFAQDSPCTMLGLEKIAKKRVGALSGGMQKRLSTALALLPKPQILLMDEVLPALDRHFRLALFSWLNEARSTGTSLLYCSHEVEELRTFCDNILVLRDGKTAYYGPSADFPTQPEALSEIMNPASS